MLLGEVGGQPRVVGPGDRYDPMMGQGGYGGQAGGYGGQGTGYGGGPGGYDPRLMPGYDPRCVYRWSNYTNQYVQPSCALCAASK